MQNQLFATRSLLHPQLQLDISNEIFVDNFAGGGGTSTGWELATGRRAEVAINHSEVALAMHAINHPETEHFCEDVFNVDPRKVANGRAVGVVWLSPDCRHHSKAKGGKPVDKRVRGLAWVGVKWAGVSKARAVLLENVGEFVSWSPLIAKRDKASGRVIKKDGSIAAPRECVPVHEQHLVANKKLTGKTFRRFVKELELLGYVVEYRELRACDYGAPTSRKRFFLIARRDGAAIVWPEVTHGRPGSIEVRSGKLAPWLTAADCMDWSVPCNSIFERSRPLAENTLRRTVKGVVQYVINNPEPYLVPWQGEGNRLLAPYIIGIDNKSNGASSVWRANDSLTTITTENRHALLCSTLVQADGESVCTNDLATKQGLVSALIVKHYTGVVGQSMEAPLGTITSIDHHSLVTSNLIKFYGTSTGQPLDLPMPTITSTGQHIGEVRCLLKKYAPDQIQFVGDDNVPVLVTIAGTKYVMTDIGLRMLQARELYNAQGFPPDYIIKFAWKGKNLSNEAQIKMVGNSVPPLLACAIFKANFPEMSILPAMKKAA